MNIKILALVLIAGVAIGSVGGYFYNQPNAEVGGGGGVTYNASYLVGDVYSGTSGALVISNGAVSATTLTASGSSTFSSGVILDTGAIVATSTLTSASDNNQLLGASAVFTTVTLPAATDGLIYKFVVTGALTGEETLIASAEGGNISGLLQVNGADVVCSAEDQINIITDGETIGDFVELLSDGTNWYLIGSQADAAGKMTCTDPS